MSRKIRSRWGATGLALVLACGVVAWMSVGSPVQARCPYPLTCVGDYATQDVQWSSDFENSSYFYHCEQVEDIAYNIGLGRLQAAGQNTCGDTNKICAQQWVKDSCIETFFQGPFPDADWDDYWMYTVTGHFEFSCKICAPTPIPHDDQEPGS